MISAFQWPIFKYRLLLNIVCFAFLASFSVHGQSGRYWSNAINEESLILGGAVVGGGAGNSAIFFNPANIAEAANTQFSLNVDLVNWDFYNLDNALGEGLSLKKSKIYFQPRFISYLITSKKIEALKYQIAAFSKEDQNLNISQTSDQILDIITSLNGEERYLGNFRLNKRYNDYWLGGGMSYGLPRGFSIGTSLFVSIKTLYNEYTIDNAAHPLSDTIIGGPEPIPFYSATYYYYELLKFNNYQLIWKIGLGYKTDNLGFGINITSPSLLLWADGKTAIRTLRQQNIMDPDGTDFLPNIDISDAQYKGNLRANQKEPWSVALGFTYRLNNSKHAFFSTVEYFHKIDPYKLVDADENSNLYISTVVEDYPQSEWLTVAKGGNAVLNAAIGYRWEVSPRILLLGGFKTDFNHQKNLNLKGLKIFNQFKGLDLDMYHITSGARLNVKEHVLFAGIKYAFSAERNLPYFINLADPEEYSETEKAALQGTRLNGMDARYFSLSFYFGATFNFGTDISIEGKN